eukprot:scaffold8417_cov83-Skeletonema_dohrnii-CCMP3373.AAC.1
MMNKRSTTAPLLGMLLAISAVASTSVVSAFNCAATFQNHAIHRSITSSRASKSARHPITFLSAKLAPNDDSSNSSAEESPSQQPSDPRRRKTFQSGLVGSLLPFFAKHANAATSTAETQPIADFPMRKLRLPKGGLGREYIIIQLYIDGNGPYDFMVDSGLTTELITPHLQSILNAKSSGITKQGLSAGDAGSLQSLVELTNVELCCGKFASGEALFPLQGPLHAIVTDFPQEHLDPSHDPVDGMLGMEVLERFDVDLDFPAGRLRLWKPVTVRAEAKRAGMTNIEAVVVNETRLLGFRVVSANAPKGSSGENVLAQPFLGVVDCGASFSVVNWRAASLLGLPPQSDSVYKKMPMVQGIGVDGRPQLLPTTNIGVSFCGNAIQNKDHKSNMSFEAPTSDWTPWSAVPMAIGDLPVFSQLLGDGRSAYKGPAGIIGLDILSQRRVILETGAGRKRRIYVGNK